MSDSIASKAVKYAVRSTKDLLFTPMDLKFLVHTLIASIYGGSGNDTKLAELQRLKQYYHGTRLLAGLSLMIVILAFFLPFTVFFIGLDGFYRLLIGYILVFIVLSFIGIPLEMMLDAIFALKYERKITFWKAAQSFASFVKTQPGQAVRYMGVKLIIDASLIALVLALFMPALLVAIALMLYILKATLAGASDVRSFAMIGMVCDGILMASAAVVTVLLSVPASSFYGYYTEDAIKSIYAIE